MAEPCYSLLNFKLLLNEVSLFSRPDVNTFPTLNTEERGDLHNLQPQWTLHHEKHDNSTNVNIANIFSCLLNS